MKKIIFNLFRNIEQKNKAQLILELLTVESTIEESITLYNKVNADFMHKMAQEKQRLKKEENLINSIEKRKSYDPNFDKPISELDINYEIVKS